MSANDFSRRITNALNLPRPSDSVTGVKDAVIEELIALDPRMKVTKTEYFNHSFAPDLVINWPSDPSVNERYIYLRFNSDIENFIEDVGLVSDTHPIVFGLSDTPRPLDPTAIERLDQSSRQLDTLVTDASGFQTFIKGETTSFMKLFSSAITKGGRGVLDAPGAEVAARAVDEGIHGAFRAMEEPTRRGARTVDAYLNEQQSSRIQGLLQAVWVAAGAPLEQFPGRRSIASELPLEALQFIFEYDAIDDDEFWRRLGDKVSLSRISGLILPSGSKNLEKFMRSNMNVLWARSCRVKRDQERLSDLPTAEPYWFTDSRFVALKGIGYSAYLADKVDDLDPVKPDTSDGITIDELYARAVQASSPIDEVAISNGHQTVKYFSDTSSVLHDESISTFAQTLGEVALVRRVEVLINDERHLSCDFTTNTAAGRTRTKLLLPELLLNAIPMLRSTNAAELASLKMKLAQDDAGPAQQELDFPTER
jgi:hypothetical protein